MGTKTTTWAISLRYLLLAMNLQFESVDSGPSSKDTKLSDIWKISFKKDTFSQFASENRITRVKRAEDDIFKQLELELNSYVTEQSQTSEEEKHESEKIFRELHGEITLPGSGRTDKNSEISKITDNVAKLIFQSRGTSDNSNILKIVSNVFKFNRGFGRKR